MREQLERALQEATRLGDERKQAEVVHCIRKRIKKVRAVLRLLKKEIGREVFQEENRRLREVAHSLAGARDAEVQLQTLARLRDCAGLESDSFASLEAFLIEQQAEPEPGPGAHEAAIALLLSIHDRLQGWPLDEVSIKTLAGAFARTYRKGRRCFRYALDHRSAEILHRWRKHTKRVWYQARILQQLKRAVVCEISENANTLGGHLGDLHDLTFLRAQLQSGAEASAAECDVVLGLICARERALEEIALDLGRRFYAEKPGAFERCLLRYADGWPPNA
ncbi:MAG: CHAD domain-containing protein [Rhodanobacteraceae bacterium]